MPSNAPHAMQQRKDGRKAARVPSKTPTTACGLPFTARACALAPQLSPTFTHQANSPGSYANSVPNLAAVVRTAHQDRLSTATKLVPRQQVFRGSAVMAMVVHSGQRDIPSSQR